MLWGLIAVATWLTGCATSPNDRAALPDRPYVPYFEISGRLSVRIGDRLDTAGFQWARESGRDTLRFFSPFGSQIAELTATPAGAMLTRDGIVERDANLTALVQTAIGVRLDADRLARWVQGMDLAGAGAVLAADGEQAPWTVTAEDLRLMQGAKVATRVVARQGETTVRVVIDAFLPK